MSLPWIKVCGDLFDHPRAVDLGDELGRPLAWAHLVALWGWCAQYAPTGRVEARNVGRTIERAARWDGEPGAFVAAAVATGWLVVEDGAATVCGWDDHQRAHLDKAEKDRQRAAARRSTVAAESRDSLKTVARQSADGLATVAGEKEKEKEKEKEPSPAAVAPEVAAEVATHPTPRKPARPKPPPDPAKAAEAAAERADGDRWRERWLAVTGTPPEDWPKWGTAWHAFVRARRTYGLEKLLAALDATPPGRWPYGEGASTWLSDAGIAKGLAAARGGTGPPRAPSLFADAGINDIHGAPEAA
jgi:hypothetical protein